MLALFPSQYPKDLPTPWTQVEPLRDRRRDGSQTRFVRALSCEPEGPRTQHGSSGADACQARSWRHRLMPAGLTSLTS